MCNLNIPDILRRNMKDITFFSVCNFHVKCRNVMVLKRLGTVIFTYRTFGAYVLQVFWKPRHFETGRFETEWTEHGKVQKCSFARFKNVRVRNVLVPKQERFHILWIIIFQRSLLKPVKYETFKTWTFWNV